MLMVRRCLAAMIGRSGDARQLPWAEASADAVLLLGPLYHLIDRADRLRALSETRRVLPPGGVLLAAAVSRFASTMDGIKSGAIADATFARMVELDVATGIHRNPDPAGHPGWITLTYFHRPEDLREEVQTSGFEEVAVLAVEGVGSFGLAQAGLDVGEQIYCAAGDPPLRSRTRPARRL